MSIEPIKPANKIIESELDLSADEIAKPMHSARIAGSSNDLETKHALDHATGLLQSIVTDKISDKVIRKMPSDEYLHLLSLLDEIISGSIDKHV